MLRCVAATATKFAKTGLVMMSMALSVAFAPVVANAGVEVTGQHVQQGIPFVEGEHQNGWPQIVTKAAVVMDMNTGTVVYAKNPNVQHYPASITKIMTAILALQDGHLTDTLTASKNAVSQPPDKLYMVAGEKEKLEPLLYGMLLDSANDVAVEIAEHYGGTVAHFAQMMNAKAKSLGATHTHFANPSGLPNPKHVTTAYDMALIARYAMQQPEFRKIVQTKYYNWKGQKWSSRLSNLNHMLFYYPGCIGLKTGFTSVAHETLVVAAKRGGTTFLAVLMDAPTDYEIRHDASGLLNYAFGHYQTQTIVQAGQTVGHLSDASGTMDPVIAADTVMATVQKGHPLHEQLESIYQIPAQGCTARSTVGQMVMKDTATGSEKTIPIEAEWAYTPDERQHPLRTWPLGVLLSIVLAGFCTTVYILIRRSKSRRNRAIIHRFR